MPHAPSAAASCEWGYDAVAHLRRAVGSTLGRVGDMLLTLWALRWCWVGDMLLTLWALRWCWVGMLVVVAYLRHAVSRGRVESRHALLRSAYRVMAGCRRSATMSADVGGDVARRWGGHTPALLRDAVMGDGVTARAVILRLWSSSASPKRRAMVDRLCPMPLRCRVVRMGL